MNAGRTCEIVRLILSVKQLTIRIELQLSNKELAELVINPNMSVVTKDELDRITEDIEETYQEVCKKLKLKI